MSRFREITPEDLRSNEALSLLYIEAVSKKWWRNTNPDVLEFFSLAEKALQDDKHGTPGRLFHDLVKRKEHERITQTQEDRALERMNGVARDSLRERAADATPSDKTATRVVVPSTTLVVPSASEMALGSHHAVVVQCVMPQARLPPGQRRYESQHGRAMLVMDAGTMIDPNRYGEIKRCPLPYGTKLRLLLPYINGYAVRHRTREICMGGSLRKFMALLGIGVDGPRGKELVSQLEALAACQITVHAWLGDQRVTRAGRVADTVTFWMKRDHRQAMVWQPSMTLSREYYESLQEHQVPINMQHLQQLTHSARRMDIYTFISYRTERVNGRGRVAIPCDAMHAIFGRRILEKHHFRARLREDLKAICKIHPFNVSLEGDMLILRKSRLPVKALPR